MNFSLKQIIVRFNRPFIAIGISVWAFYLRYQNLASRELWNDELYQLEMTLGELKPFWREQISVGDLSSFPGDYVLTWPFVHLFYPNKWLMAIPHMISTVIGFFLLYHLCKKSYKTIWGYLIAFLIVCHNENLIFHSFELRPYAVLPTLLLASFMISEKLFLHFERFGLTKKIFTALFYSLTIWFHAFGVLIVFFPIVFHLLSNKWDYFFKDRSGQRIFRFILIVMTVSIPIWYWFATGNPFHLSPERHYLQGIHTFAVISNPIDGFWRFFNRTVLYNLVGFKPMYFLLGALALFIIVPFANKLKKLSFFLIMILLPIETILFAALLNHYWFLVRQYVYLVPVFALFLGGLWDACFDYYINAFKQKISFPFRAKIGLVMMVGCLTAGSIGVILRLIGH